MDFGPGIDVANGIVSLADCPKGNVLLSTGDGWTCGDLPNEPVFARTVHTETVEKETILHQGFNTTEVGLILVASAVVAIAVVLLERYVR